VQTSEESVDMTKIKFIVSLLVIVLITVSSQNSNSSLNNLAKGQKAPDIALTAPDGKEVMLSKLKGKMVLVDFWASWCGPCRRENPNVVEAYTKYKSAKFKNAKGFEVYSVSLDRAEDPWKKAIIEDKLAWKNHGWDNKGTAANLYNVTSIPSAFLIDGDGTVIALGQELRGIGLHLMLDKQLK
jgi:thiol-disulfide isomerase/thioredoxin